MREFWGPPPEGYSVFEKDIAFSEHVGHWYHYVKEAAAMSDAFEVNPDWQTMLESVDEDFMKGLFPDIIYPTDSETSKKSKKKK